GRRRHRRGDHLGGSPCPGAAPAGARPVRRGAQPPPHRGDERLPDALTGQPGSGPSTLIVGTPLPARTTTRVETRPVGLPSRRIPGVGSASTRSAGRTWRSSSIATRAYPTAPLDSSVTHLHYLSGLR